MSKKKKNILWIVITVVLMLMIVFLIGRSFGFFKYRKEGEEVNYITIKGIELEIVDPETDSLNLENAYPVDDSEGLSYTPFVFNMKNTSSKPISYSILVENDENKQASCVVDGNLICPKLSTDYIKYSYKKNDGTYTKPQNLGQNNNIITTDTIEGNNTITSSIILWIDSEAGNEIMNHYFYGKLIVTGEAETK